MSDVLPLKVDVQFKIVLAKAVRGLETLNLHFHLAAFHITYCT